MTRDDEALLLMRVVHVANDPWPAQHDAPLVGWVRRRRDGLALLMVLAGALALAPFAAALVMGLGQ